MAKQHLVKCLYCGKTFDIEKEEYVKPNKIRYAHKACTEAEENKKTKEEEDREELETYICNLFAISRISPKIAKQIKTFHDENRYSYSAIRKTLIYFFEVKHNSIDKANEGIGIVPWAVLEARKYWQGIEQAQQKNQNKEADIESYRAPPKEIYISNPQRITMKHSRNTFTFLDEG